MEKRVEIRRSLAGPDATWDGYSEGMDVKICAEELGTYFNLERRKRATLVFSSTPNKNAYHVKVGKVTRKNYLLPMTPLVAHPERIRILDLEKEKRIHLYTCFGKWLGGIGAEGYLSVEVKK